MRGLASPLLCQGVDMRLPIIRSMNAVCTNDTVQDVYIDEWPNTVNIRWKQITAIDATGSVTCAQVGVIRANDFYPFRAAALGAAHRSVRFYGDLLVPGSYAPCARFYGATLGDELQLFVAGELEG